MLPLPTIYAYLGVVKLGYIHAMFAAIIATIVAIFLGIVIADLHSQRLALLDGLPPLLADPRVLNFFQRHPRLYDFLRHHLRLPAFTLRPPPRPPSLGASPLGRLAPEIIQHIASLLPPSAAASFASTCLPIRLITGTTYLAPLRASAFETLTLLEYLTLDLPTNPTHLLCLFCRRLVPYPALCGPTSTPYCKEVSAQCQPYIPSTLCPQILHTAMALYNHGRSPYPLFAAVAPRSKPTVRLDNGAVRQKAWEYRIIRGSLYQRTRWTFILPRCDFNYTIHGQPCPHYATYQSRINAEAIRMQNLARDKASVPVCSEMVSCRQCRTVFRVGCRKFRGLGLGLFVTCWVDIGDGRWVAGKTDGLGWKDVKYTREWLTDHFESLCHSQRYFRFCRNGY